MSAFEFFEEAILPLLLYGLFSVICISSAVRAIKQVSKLRKGRFEVIDGRIIRYNKQKIKMGRYVETRHYITVSINDEERPAYYTLTTNSSKAKRYESMEQTEIYFIENEKTPFLKEDIRHIYIDSIIGVIGGVICVLFTLLAAAALIYYFIDRGE